MSEFYLLYVNHVGKDYKDNQIYEFIFGDSIKNIDGEDWDVYPASGRPSPPNDCFIKKVGRLESELKLDVIQNSDIFAVWDGVDGVVSIAYENINAYDSYPENRLCFRFGEPMTDVEAKLYEKDLILKYSKETHEKEN